MQRPISFRRPISGRSPRSGSVRLHRPTTARTRYAALCVAAVLAGYLALLPSIPSALSALLLGAFIFLGPGSAIMTIVRRPPVSPVLLVPVLGVVLVIISSAATATFGWWSPIDLSIGLALTTMAVVSPSLPALIEDVTS